MHFPHFEYDRMMTPHTILYDQCNSGYCCGMPRPSQLLHMQCTAKSNFTHNIRTTRQPTHVLVTRGIYMCVLAVGANMWTEPLHA